MIDEFGIGDVVRRLEKWAFGNGAPPLEERVFERARAYTDTRDDHRRRNLAESEQMMANKIEEVEKAQIRMHDENNKQIRAISTEYGKKMDRIQWILVTTLAAIIVELVHGFVK